MTEEDEQGPTGVNFAKRSARLGELELAGRQCCVQLVPNKWVCALGGPRDAPLLSASSGSARAPPPKLGV